MHSLRHAKAMNEQYWQSLLLVVEACTMGLHSLRHTTTSKEELLACPAVLCYVRVAVADGCEDLDIWMRLFGIMIVY